MQRRSPPYLPFLDGPPEFAPNLKPIPVSDWLLPDVEADASLPQKRRLIADIGDRVCGGEIDGAAATEFLELVTIEHPGLIGADNGAALTRVALNVSDDICILQRDQKVGEGTMQPWCLQAGIVCAPTYWTLTDRIGLSLAGLHEPVVTPDHVLAKRIDRVFSGLKAGTVLERFNWTVQASDERYTPARPSARDRTPLDLHLRVERQTLRKLPMTEAVVFTIRISLDPLLPILEKPEFRAALMRAWSDVSANVRAYKSWNEFDDLFWQACHMYPRLQP